MADREVREVPAVPDEGLARWLAHDEDCPAADPVSDHDKARYYADTGRLPADEDCTCGLADALASVVPAASVPAPSEGLTGEERELVDRVAAQVEAERAEYDDLDPETPALLAIIDRLAASVPAPSEGLAASERADVATAEDAVAAWAAGESDVGFGNIVQDLLAIVRRLAASVPAVGPGEGERWLVTCNDGERMRVVPAWGMFWPAGNNRTEPLYRLVPVSADPRSES